MPLGNHADSAVKACCFSDEKEDHSERFDDNSLDVGGSLRVADASTPSLGDGDSFRVVKASVSSLREVDSSIPSLRKVDTSVSLLRVVDS